jgi:mono/diheme cytochrome c family protein
LKELPPEFGEISSRNITQNKQVGIGDWTDGEIYYLLRTGIKRDGQYIPPYMAKFPNASEEDIYSIIAWLRSDKFCVQPSTTEASESKPSFLTKFLSRVAFKPLPINKAPIPSPDTTNKVEWGRYLSTAVYGCYACHSADFKTMNEVEPEKSGGYFGGGNVMKDLSNKDVVTSNLTFDETGIAKLTLEQFINEVRYCKKPDGSMLRYPMFPHNGLTDSEVAAIYEYLKTLPKINHKIASN